MSRSKPISPWIARMRDRDGLALLVGSAGVVGVIVVAEDAEFAVAPLQCLEPLNPRFCLVAVVVDQIASEAEDVRVERLDHVQPGLHNVELAEETPEVGIGNLDDAQAFQTGGQVGNGHVVPPHVVAAPASDMPWAKAPSRNPAAACPVTVMKVRRGTSARAALDVKAHCPQ